MTGVMRRDVLSVALATGTLALARRSSGRTAEPTLRYKSFRPGQMWLDTAGKPIQAHGGSLIAVGHDFYWYGENKEFTDGKRGIESWGIRFYRSRDLYNWEDLGPLIPPDTVDSTSPLSPKVFPERPHILFNPRTRKFVCWIKIRGAGPEYRAVLTADAITGPYTMVHRKLNPVGMAAGDFDLVADPLTGKAYMYFEHDHKELVCITLNNDWTNVTDQYSRHFQRVAPYTKEGLAFFHRRGKLYLTNSGMTGYFPNPSEVAIADGYDCPFRDLGDLHPTDRSRTSFNSQISCIFQHPRRRDLYIALADRWLPLIEDEPSFSDGTLSERVRSGIIKATAHPRKALTTEERDGLIRYSAPLANVNTSISRYVWLPLSFEGGHPQIRWHDEWRISDIR
ncbi:MAG: family 43 glycosylhydrolase [Rhizorhabdus sp.]